MIFKPDFYCLDAGLCNFQNEECYIVIWCSRKNGDKVASLYRKSDREEILIQKIGERQFVTSSSFNVLSQSLKVLEVRDLLPELPYSSFVLKFFDLLNGKLITQTHTPKSSYNKFLISKEKGGGLVLAFMYYEEEDEYNDLPLGITLLEYDSNLMLVNSKDHPFNKTTPQMINYFCSASTSSDISVLVESEDSDAWLYTFSLDTLGLIKRRKLIPEGGGFGYIRAMAIKDDTAFLISANWTLFEVALHNSTEISRKRLNFTGDKIPSVLFWDDYQWLAGGNYEKVGKIISNAESFILSIED